MPKSDQSPGCRATAASTARTSGVPAAISAEASATKPPRETRTQHGRERHVQHGQPRQRRERGPPNRRRPGTRIVSPPGPSCDHDHATRGDTDRWSEEGSDEERGCRCNGEPRERRRPAQARDTHGPEPQAGGHNRTERQAQAGWQGRTVRHGHAPDAVRRHTARERDAGGYRHQEHRGHGPRGARERLVRMMRRPRSVGNSRRCQINRNPYDLAAHDRPQSEPCGTGECPPGGDQIREPGGIRNGRRQHREEGEQEVGGGRREVGGEREGAPGARQGSAQQQPGQQRERHEPGQFDGRGQHGDACLATRDGDHVERCAGEPGADAGRDARGGVGEREPAGHQERTC